MATLDYKTIVVHIPHASTEIPADVRPDFVLTDEELRRELLRVTDHYTDTLFGLEDERVTIVRYPVSRLVSDPERFRDDDLEPLAKKGIGAVYTHRPSNIEQRLRRETCTVGRDTLLERYYDPHHRRLEEAVNRGLERGPVLIIDGHSFPKEPLDFEADPDGPREPICLGTDEFHTPPFLLAELRARFEHLGYPVTVNRPFEGTIVPLKHYKKTRAVHSIMIELRRDIYMEEATGSRSADFETVRENVGRVILA